MEGDTVQDRDLLNHAEAGEEGRGIFKLARQYGLPTVADPTILRAIANCIALHLVNQRTLPNLCGIDVWG